MDSFSLFRAWRADLARYRPHTTAQLYRRTAFAAFADLPHPTDWTTADLRRYLDAQTPAGAKLTRQALADFTGWMVRRGHRPDDPLEKVPVRRGRVRLLRRGMSVEELGRLLHVVEHPSHERWAPVRRRLSLMIQGNYLTGLRPGEMCSLTTADVHLDDNPRLTVFATKTQTERVVPLSEAGVRVFTELREDRVGRLFNIGVQTYHEQLSRWATLAGLPPEKRRPYALRHSFGYQLAEAGVHVTRIAQLMGHSDVRVTLGYTVASDPELRAAVEMLRLPPDEERGTDAPRDRRRRA